MSLSDYDGSLKFTNCIYHENISLISIFLDVYFAIYIAKISIFKG